jgi:hypothetical protein
MNKKILFIIFASIMACKVGLACSCVGTNTIKQELRKSNVVFVGRVLSHRTFIVVDSALPKGFTMKMAEYRILKSRIYKGEIKTDTISIITGIGGGDCGLEFIVGEEYIVYAKYLEQYFDSGNKIDKFLYTNICTRTTKTNNKELRKIRKLTAHSNK